MSDDWGISCEIAPEWLSLDLTDDKSTLVQVMAWCHQVTSHYLSQCWLRSVWPYGVTRPLCVTHSFAMGGLTCTYTCPFLFACLSGCRGVQVLAPSIRKPLSFSLFGFSVKLMFHLVVRPIPCWYDKNEYIDSIDWMCSGSDSCFLFISWISCQHARHNQPICNFSAAVGLSS